MPAVDEALRVTWTGANEICSKRLVPFLPGLGPALERHGHLACMHHVRTLLLTLNSATVPIVCWARYGSLMGSVRPGGRANHSMRGAGIIVEWLCFMMYPIPLPLYNPAQRS